MNKSVTINSYSSDDDGSGDKSIMSNTTEEGLEAVTNDIRNLSRLWTRNGDSLLSFIAPTALNSIRGISIMNALTHSATLVPVDVDVQNDTSWYRSRKHRGPTKQNALIVELNSKTSWYESFMYRMKLRLRMNCHKL